MTAGRVTTWAEREPEMVDTQAEARDREAQEAEASATFLRDPRFREWLAYCGFTEADIDGRYRVVDLHASFLEDWGAE